MVAVPADTPDTIPVEGFTVATPGEPDEKAPPASPLDVKLVDPLLHIAWVPFKVPAKGAIVTVTVLVAVALAQPPVPVTV